MTYEEATKPGAGAMEVYFASKKLSEEAVHRFAKEHPDIEVSTGMLYWAS